MSLTQKKEVDKQLTLLLEDRSLTSLDDLLPEREWRLLETVCYEAGRKLEDLCLPDLKRAIPQWGDRSWIDLVGPLYTKEKIALCDVVDYIIERLTENNFRIPTLNRYKIFKAQMEECKTAEKVDWNSMLPETIRELYKLMCIATNTPPMNVEVKTFLIPIPELGKSLSDLGFLTWYFKEKNCGSLGGAVTAIKGDQELHIKDLYKEVSETCKRRTLLEKIQKYKGLNWKQDLVVSEEEKKELGENAKKTEIYRKFENVPDFRPWDVNKLVEALNRGDSFVKDRLLERYSKTVTQRALPYVGMGIDYTELVMHVIGELKRIIEGFDFKGIMNFPLHINRQIPLLLEKAVNNARLVATSIVEKPRNKYEEVLLKFLYDFKDALEKYRGELELKLSGKDTLEYRPELVVTGNEKEKLELAAYRNYLKTSLGRWGDRRKYRERVAKIAIGSVGSGVDHGELVKYVVDNTDRKDMSLKSSILHDKIEGKINLAIRIARNSALRDGVDSLTEEINYSISDIKEKGLTSKSEEIIDAILHLLGKIELRYEYCIRAYHGLGDTRYDLQVGITQLPTEIIKADPRLSGGGEFRQNIEQRIQKGFELLVKEYIHNPN